MISAIFVHIFLFMTIDERLANTAFPLPAIREVNQAMHPTGITLGLGELKEFDVDPQIFEAMYKSIESKGKNYCPNAGVVELRQAIAKRQFDQDGYDYSADNVVVTIGVQNAVYTSIKTLSKLGAKRVLIPEIHFGIYRKIPLEFNLELATYQLTSDFGIDLEALQLQLKEDDLLIINSPANPTGRVLSNNELSELANVLKQKLTKGYVLSDEIYGQLVYDGNRPNSFTTFFDRCIVVDGISKSGAVAGLRVGWAISKKEQLVKAMVSNNATIISAPPTPNQMAAIPVVQGATSDTISFYNETLRRNRNYVISELSSWGIPFVKPSGSFYLLADISSKVQQVKDFCIATAQKEKGVVVIPGAAFGAHNYIRISLASKQLKEGMHRLKTALFK
jgi:aspartate/methionine/tyrosine aminotransferase